MAKRVQVRWSVPSFARSMLLICAAALLGLLVDQTFQWVFQNHPDATLLRIMLQFAVIVFCVALFQNELPQSLSINLISDVFIVSVFLGVQLDLFRTAARVRLVPWPPTITPPEL